MKKFLFIIIFPLLGFGQKITCPTYIQDKYFIKSENKIEVKSRFIYSKNASDECVKVKFTFKSNERQFALTNPSDINRMVVYANIEVMTHMKNKYSYVPRSIDVYFSEKLNKWIVDLEYTAENDFGGNRNGFASVQFTTTGEFFDTDFR